MNSPYRITRPKSIIGLVLIAVIAMFFTLLFSSSAFAEPAAITKAKQEAQALRNLINQLDNDLSAAAESYNYAAQQLSDTKAAVVKTGALLRAAKYDLENAQESFSERMVLIYKQGHTSAINALFEADNFSSMLNRYDQLSRLSEKDNEIINEVKEYSAQVEEKKSELDAQQADLEVKTAELEAAKKKVEEQLAKQKQQLKGKEAQIAQLQREEEERQARLRAAAEQAAREREAAARRAATTNTGGGNSGGGGTKTTPTTKKTGGSGGGGGGNTNVGTSNKGPQAVSIGMQYLGVPYVWGGSSTKGFDCSGFVMYVYGKLGVSLPHSSRMMYGYGTPVSRSQLQPGDLVFFFSPIHHVGIYIGGGQMVNATGNKVQISSIWSSYVGARRIF